MMKDVEVCFEKYDVTFPESPHPVRGSDANPASAPGRSCGLSALELNKVGLSCRRGRRALLQWRELDSEEIRAAIEATP